MQVKPQKIQVKPQKEMQVKPQKVQVKTKEVQKNTNSKEKPVEKQICYSKPPVIENKSSKAEVFVNVHATPSLSLKNINSDVMEG